MGDRESYFYNYLVVNVSFGDEFDLLTGYETSEEALMAQRHRLRPFHGDTVEQFQHIERELLQVIGQVLTLTEPPVFIYSNDQEFDPVNQDVGAIVDGYDPRMADVDIELEEVEDAMHFKITDEEFHSMVASMNI